MSFWAYMLHCRGGYFYVGHTDDLGLRVAQHQTGAIAGFAADHRPVELVWSQEFQTRDDARAAERQIKGWSRAKKMALIRGDWDKISSLARGKGSPSTSSGKSDVGETVFPITDHPELVEGLSLLCHPLTPCKAVKSVDVRIEIHAKAAPRFRFVVVGEMTRLLLPSPTEPAFKDNLWTSTCFEVFSKQHGVDWYDEFNLSPSGDWAAYSFGGYREGMDRLRTLPPDIRTDLTTGTFELTADVALVNDAPPCKLALSAVIEETDGTKSYWALRHPPGAPDFHHPDCFALTLEAPPPA